MATKR